MMSPGGSIVASLENINGFLDVNTLPDNLIRTDFKQEADVPKVMLYIFEEFVLLLGRHPFHNKVPRMVACKIGKPWGVKPPEQSRLGILLVKQHTPWLAILFPLLCNELEHRSLFCLHGVLVENDLFFVALRLHLWQNYLHHTYLKRKEERSILFKKTGHRPGCLRKILYESSIEADMTEETTDTLNGSGMR
nr:hypothetical protein [Tanacetum cinerariifolium]